MTKIISWNVNGIRACLSKKPSLLDFINTEKPDIICLQEVKANQEQVDIKIPNFEHQFWNSAEKKGYSGVAVFSKLKPINVKHGIGVLDEEGRVLTLEFENFFLVNVYTPNSKPDLSRLDLRYHEWDVKFLEHVKKLEESKPVIFCGDLNAAHKEIDIARPDANKTTEKKPGTAGFTDKEREGIDKILDANFIDTFRLLNKDKIKYTWWTYRFNARANNVGWRIDYFFTSKILKEKITEAKILDEVFGSDHCPVLLNFII